MIEPGERAPDFALPKDAEGAVTRFYGLAGGSPAVLVLSGGDPAAAASLGDELRHREVVVHVVTTGGGGDGHAGDGHFVDTEGNLHEAWDVDSDGPPVAAVLDANVRVRQVVAVEGVTAAADAVTEAIELLEGLGEEESTITAQAPVLLVPEAISAGMADRVLEAWRESEPEATGVETTADGRRIEALDDLRKRRRDHVVGDKQLLRTLTQHVGRRVIPEVRQAFAFTAKGFEGFKIGRYDDTDEGFFAAHRDNISPATAHRRFALSINLNDDYEGGELVFPEYGGHRYRPAAREALIFSGSLLHAVRPVTRGHRFVLLSFLFGAERPRG